MIASHIGQINFYIGFIAGIKAFVAAVLGAMMSTIDSILLLAGSLVVENIYVKSLGRASCSLFGRTAGLGYNYARDRWL